MVKEVVVALTILLGIRLVAISQETFPVNGPKDERPIHYAFVNATIFTSSSQKLENATLLIGDGKVVDVGPVIPFPEGTVTYDCKGMVIYPSFIDLYAAITNKPKASHQFAHSHWNPSIHPEHNFNPPFPFKENIQNNWLSAGFGVVNLHLRDGIMRGSSALIHAGVDPMNKALIHSEASEVFSFKKGSNKLEYPSAHMGAVALIRQSYYDALWYADNMDPTKESTAAYEVIQKKHWTNPLIFELNNELAVRNVQHLETEFELDFIIKSNGETYKLDRGQIEGQQFIVPLNFPKPYDVADPFEARMVSLSELKHWETAPFNLHYLLKKGAEVALTQDTLSSKVFLKHLKQLTQSGVTHEQALKALTETPALWLNQSNVVGKLEPGMLANFFVATHQFNEKGFKITEHWNRGEKVYEKRIQRDDLVGKYKLIVNENNIELEITSVSEKGIQAKAFWKEGNADLIAKVQRSNDLLTLVFLTKDEDQKMLYQLTGKLSLSGSVWDGKGQNNTGQWVTWAGIKDRKEKPSDKEERRLDSTDVAIPELSYPNMAYGFNEPPSGGTFVLTNAHVWTCSDSGVYENADIYVVDGVIEYVGKDRMFPSDLTRINANGKHVTPGIIDEHSHIGVFGGVNEWGQASSAEVRIEDAVDPNNINIYRQLAGGVTAAQLLHGSANPIGGQSALIEMKWGESADEILIDDAPGFIKFALGENVKRSNVPGRNKRYPNTRMGVEQVFADHFIRAAEYQSKKLGGQEPTSNWRNRTTENVGQRIDLELEALVEILNDERFITCHSYVQSEILMLMNLADSLGFRVNTFTHILEGYKITDEMVAHNAAGSTFSDWWAYKFEVNDAIPHNAFLMHKGGVNVAINSDDAEMGRRLNQEAAKAVKYGGLSEEEALNLVTINPAKMLHLDDKMGSIEVGKKANLVIWTDHPLSVYTRAEKTLIEGKVYYDLNNQEWHEEYIARERSRIIAKMIEDDTPKKKAAKKQEHKHYHCDTMLENYWEE